MCMDVCLNTCVCTASALDALGGQKRASDPLGLEVQMAVNLFRCREPNLTLGQELWMLLMAEPSLQPL